MRCDANFLGRHLLTRNCRLHNTTTTTTTVPKRRVEGERHKRTNAKRNKSAGADARQSLSDETIAELVQLSCNFTSEGGIMLRGKGSKNTAAYSQSWWAFVKGQESVASKLLEYTEANVIDLFTLCGREVHRKDREKLASQPVQKTPRRRTKRNVIEDSEDDGDLGDEANGGDRPQDAEDHVSSGTDDEATLV